jgi:hypothetical protein
MEFDLANHHVTEPYAKEGSECGGEPKEVKRHGFSCFNYMVCFLPAELD